MASEWLKLVDAIRRAQQQAVDEDTMAAARRIVDEVRCGGDAALKACIQRFEGRSEEQLVLSRDALAAAFDRLPDDVQALLKRTATVSKPSPWPSAPASTR